KSGEELMGNVATILQTNFPGRELVIEGHTDNQPIKYSGWGSNWELGSARALTVLHTLAEKHGFDPGKLSATTYGEFRPDVPNATPEGRASNRRSVIVILPEKLPLQRNTLAGL
ncbi:OmpA family protein, partial [Candidatus Poribacteria bacterium]|nr:OmpA family protein [Candidatus Poribacteria bacterium]